MATLLTPRSRDCLPRFSTERTSRPTYGPAVAQVGERLGTPLMPWQRLVADTALEVDPTTGRLAYRQVVLTVPRQSGKTTMLLALMAWRALYQARQRIVYTAQTRNDARQKWEDDHVVALEASPFRKKFRVRKTNGNEAVIWRNGSMHSIASTTEKSGHGKTLDLGVVDEAFAQTDDRLEQSMRPPMLTRPEPQLWVVSTAGTEASVYLNSKVDDCRRLVRDGTDSTTAFFEWSAEEDADPADPATWLSCIPSLGHTVDIEAIRSEQQTMKEAEFRRAYLNLRTGKHSEPAEIRPEEWLALVDPETVFVGRPTLAVEVSWNREWTAITAAGTRADGLRHVEVVEYRRGTSWVVDVLPGMVDRNDPHGVVLDPGGPAGGLVADLEAAGVELVKVTTRDVVQATAGVLDLIRAKVEKDGQLVPAPMLRHNGDPILTNAVSVGQLRTVGDAHAWRRRDAIGDVSPLISMTLASWGHTVLASQDSDYDVLASFY